MSTGKDEIRAQMRKTRSDVSPELLADISQRIADRLIKDLPWNRITSLHSYIPLLTLKEIDTWPLLNYVWRAQPQITTAVVSAQRARKFTNLKVGPATKWKGLRPDSPVIMPDDFQYDLIIVPTLAFDKNCNRVGWGGGFYDRFLGRQEKALKVGIAYKYSISECLPVESHDVALNFIVTESYTYRNDSNGHKNRTD